jgi:hypothetical protein
MKRSTFLLLMLVMLAVLLNAGTAIAGDSCKDCHENSQTMKDAGYPQFALSPAAVRAQTHMPAACTDCHLGNAGAASKEDAHGGMLMLRAVRQKTWEVTARSSMAPEDVMDWPNLEPRGQRATQLFPKRLCDGDSKTTLIIRPYLPIRTPALAFNPGSQKPAGNAMLRSRGAF